VLAYPVKLLCCQFLLLFASANAFLNLWRLLLRLLRLLLWLPLLLCWHLLLPPQVQYLFQLVMVILKLLPLAHGKYAILLNAGLLFRCECLLAGRTQGSARRSSAGQIL
jgi:hypothetical protein